MCMYVCVLLPTNTRVKHKAIRQPTWPRGEGSTERDGEIDGQKGGTGVQKKGKGRNKGLQIAASGRRVRAVRGREKGGEEGKEGTVEGRITVCRWQTESIRGTAGVVEVMEDTLARSVFK